MVSVAGRIIVRIVSKVLLKLSKVLYTGFQFQISVSANILFLFSHVILELVDYSPLQILARVLNTSLSVLQVPQPLLRVLSNSVILFIEPRIIFVPQIVHVLAVVAEVVVHLF